MEREAEAAKEELAVGEWQSFEEIINSTTTKSTTTITTVGSGLSSSKDYNGAKLIVSEQGESSFGSSALKNEDADFDDSKTSPDHVILDFTAATTSAIQGGAEINPEEEVPFKTDLYLETVCTKPENYNFYCPNCKACIEKVLIRNEEEMRCPTCLECVKFIGGWVLQKFTRGRPEGPVSPRPTLPSGTNPETSVTILEDDSLKQESLITSLVRSRPTPTPPGTNLEANAVILEASKQESLITSSISPQPTPSGTNPEANVMILEDDSSKQESLITSLVRSRPTPSGTNPEANVMILEDDSLKQESLITSLVRSRPTPLGTNLEANVVILEASKQESLITSSISPQPTPSGTNPEANVMILEDDSLTQESTITSSVRPSPLPLPPPAPPLPPKSPLKWEILKSMVYGGLLESITSLSIVTSAASSATATLNIVALALANLVGGLFVVGHNLRELKNEQYRVASNQEGEQVDRYEKIFGQKKNFILHASVAVLSFLVFGLVPPLVYGFSFYGSDNKYLKLAAVAAASVLCITLLAIAKASIQNPPVFKYITTVLHYLAIGVAASGISYLAGYLLEKLMEKLGLFESTATVYLPIPKMSSVKNGWGSY